MGAEVSETTPILAWWCEFPGSVFGRLTVLREQGRNAKQNRLWLCRCECGTEITATTARLRNGNTKSCGCLSRDHAAAKARERNYRHGMARTVEYQTWKGMIQRCTNPAAPDFACYGGRGITVCRRWLEGFENFYADMGPRPDGFSLDRIEVDGDYAPENCRWASNLRQQNNRRSNHFLTVAGKTQSIADWAREYGLSDATISGRIKRGWDADRAVTTPAGGQSQ